MMSSKSLSSRLRTAAAAALLSTTTLADRIPETNGKTVTSWIPLTTAFPNQPGCSEQYWSYVPNTMAAWDPGYGISVQDKSCHPRAATTWWDAERLGPNTLTTMSIGPITCPQAYYTASTSVKDSISTLIGCCPSGYTFFDFKEPGDTGQCWSSLSVGQVVTYATRDASQSWYEQTTTVTSGITVAGIPINGWNIAATAPSAGENGVLPAASPAGELSAGAKAGIALGATFGVVGLATLGCGVWMLHRARTQLRSRNSGGQAAGEWASMMAERRVPPYQQQHAKIVPMVHQLSTSSSRMGSPTAQAARSATSYTSRNHPWASHGQVIAHGGGGGGGEGSSSSSGGSNGDLVPEQMGQAAPVMPVDATELPVVVSPVLHPGDLQPQGYGPPSWKPGAVYR